jgi:hypothetical protein
MNNQLTEIAFILDRSGSMESCKQAAIEGFNQFLHDQKDTPGQARITLVLFDDHYETPYISVPLEEMVPLDDQTYQTRGSTALFDAIGRTIDDLGARLAAQPEEQRPGLVIVSILTDGQENASQRFTVADISAKITHQRDTYQWNFLFLGANQDAIASAAQINIAARDAATYTGDSIGTSSGQRAMSRKMKSMRTTAYDPRNLTAQESADLEAPLSQLAEDEDKKSRES